MIKYVEKMLKIFKEPRTQRPRSQTFTTKQKPLTKNDTSIKLQDIAKRDFVINESLPRTSTAKTKNFIPGVVRKQLVKRANTDNPKKKRKESDDDICKHFIYHYILLKNSF